MNQKNNTKAYSIVLPMFIFAALMLFTQSCDTVADEVCEEVEELCEEVVTVCSSTSDEYYIVDNDTIMCSAVNDCDEASLAVISSCTETERSKEVDIQLRLQTILTNVRSLNY